MAVQTGQGAKFYIGPANTTADEQAEFEALSFTLVGEVQDIGEFGDAWNNTTFVALDDSRVRKFKTTKDAGDPTIVIGMDASDSGQTSLVSAFTSTSDYAIRISLDDAGDGSPSNPTTYYFRAKVMSKRIAGITNENIVLRNVRLSINSDVLEIAASGN